MLFFMIRNNVPVVVTTNYSQYMTMLFVPVYDRCYLKKNYVFFLYVLYNFVLKICDICRFYIHIHICVYIHIHTYLNMKKYIYESCAIYVSILCIWKIALSHTLIPRDGIVDLW